jgi:hypothetical protein
MLCKFVMSVYQLNKMRRKRSVATLLIPACIPQIGTLRTDRTSAQKQSDRQMSGLLAESLSFSASS